MDYLSGWWEQSVPGLLTAALGAFSQHCSQLRRLSDFCVHSRRGDKWVPYEDGKRGRLKQEEKHIGQALEGSVESLRKRPFLSVWMEVGTVNSSKIDPFNPDAYILNLIKDLLWPISNKSWLMGHFKATQSLPEMFRVSQKCLSSAKQLTVHEAPPPLDAVVKSVKVFNITSSPTT